MNHALKYEEALPRILAAVSPLGQEICPVRQSLGRVLAEDVRALHNQPDLPRSAVDGYAVQADQSPEFHVVMEVRAGVLPDTLLAPGQAAAVMTGAVIPKGADCVVMIEDCQVQGHKLQTPTNLKSGGLINPEADEITAGEVFAGCGTFIGPSVHPALLCAGLREVSVFRHPRVGLLVSGDEVREVEDGPAPGQVFNTNRTIVEAVCAGLGIQILETCLVKDDEPATREKLSQLEQTCDVIITSGGVSMGRHDFLGKILRGDGYELLLQGTAIKPGRPLHLARATSGALIFGMPGYPSALLTNAFVYLVPALKTICGRGDFHTRWFPVTLQDAQRGRPDKTTFNRVKLVFGPEGIFAANPGSQMASHFLSFARCNGLVRMPLKGPTPDPVGPFTLEAGTVVEALDFGWELS